MSSDLSGARTESKSAVFEVDVDSEQPGRARLRARGELALASAELLCSVVEAQLRGGRRYLNLDLSAVTYCDAAGLNALLRVHRDVLAARGALVLTSINPGLDRLLAVAVSHRNPFVVAWPDQPPAASHPEGPLRPEQQPAAAAASPTASQTSQQRPTPLTEDARAAAEKRLDEATEAFATHAETIANRALDAELAAAAQEVIEAQKALDDVNRGRGTA